MKYNRIAVAALCLTLGVFASALSAQSVEEYKAATEAADRKEGCTSIPFGDLRDRCVRASDFVEQDCKRKQFGCEGLENKKLAENIKGKEDAISAQKSQKSDLEGKRSSASDEDKAKLDSDIKDLQDKIDTGSKDLEEMKKTLETDRSDAGIRADQGRRCLEARNDVQYLFTSATSSAKSENDESKKPFAEKLVAYWEQGARDHEEAVKLTKEAIDKCEKRKSGEE